MRARHLVIATNAYTGQLRLLRSRILPLYVQLFRTAPLGPEQRRSIDWHGREGIYTAHEILESYRLTRDGRIVEDRAIDPRLVELSVIPVSAS